MSRRFEPHSRCRTSLESDDDWGNENMACFAARLPSVVVLCDARPWLGDTGGGATPIAQS